MADLPLEHVSRPPDEPTEGPTPAVVVVHGRGADERDLLPVAAELPDELHVLSVRAPDRMGPGYTWYELDLSAGGLHASQPDPADFRRSLDRLHGFVDAAVEAYGLAPRGVGLLGFSQGAVTSLSAMVERHHGDVQGNPEVTHPWVVALHGYLAAEHDDPELLSAAAGTPVFLGAGERDEIIPARRAERAAASLRDAGLAVTFRTYPVGHGTSPGEVRDAAEWVGERLGG